MTTRGAFAGSGAATAFLAPDLLVFIFWIEIQRGKGMEKGLLGSVEFVCLLSDLNNVFGAQPG